MLQKFRNYLTPIVATVAVAVLAASAVALGPEVVDRLTGDSQHSQLKLDEATDSQQLETPEADDDQVEPGDADELEVEPVEQEDADETGTATPSASDSNEPNHGHMVSCIAHMAKEDQNLEPGQKGAVVSYVARNEELQMAKGDDCSAAYGAAKTAALSEARGQGQQPTETQAVKQEEKKAEHEPESPVTSQGEVEHEQQDHGGPQGSTGPEAETEHSGGHGPKK